MIELVFCTQPEQLPAGVLGDALRACETARARLDAFEAGVLSRMKLTDTHRREGAVSRAEFLARECGVSRHEAIRREKLADTLEALPATRDAMTRGEATAGHAEALGKAHDLDETEEQALLDGAASADELHRAVRQRQRRIDDDHGRSRLNRQHTKRRLTTYDDDDEMRVTKISLDDEQHAVLHTAIDGVVDELWRTNRNRNERASESRSLQQLRADALIELVRRGTGKNTKTTKSKPAIMVTVDASDLDAATLVDGQPLPPEVLQRLACDSVVHTLLVDANAQPLWMGTNTRCATPAQWLALIARDRHCQIPGCTAPHTWCEAHHIIHWLHHGPTDIDNLVLICTRHHRLIHDGGWRLTGKPGALALHPPLATGTDPPRQLSPNRPPPPNRPREQPPTTTRAATTTPTTTGASP